MELGAALAHDDVAGDDDLAAEFLDAQPAPGAVAAVARGAARLFVCHLEPSCAAPKSDTGADLGDPQHGLVLAVAVLAPVIVPPLFLEHDDLVGPALLDHGGADR